MCNKEKNSWNIFDKIKESEYFGEIRPSEIVTDSTFSHYLWKYNYIHNDITKDFSGVFFQLRTASWMLLGMLKKYYEL